MPVMIPIKGWDINKKFHVLMLFLDVYSVLTLYTSKVVLII